MDLPSSVIFSLFEIYFFALNFFELYTVKKVNFFICLVDENITALISTSISQNFRNFQYRQLAQHQPKSQILFHENVSPLDLYIMTLVLRPHLKMALIRPKRISCRVIISASQTFTQQDQIHFRVTCEFSFSLF